MLKSRHKLDLASIESLLKTQIIGRPLSGKNELWDELNSTNDRALTLAQMDGHQGTIVLARSQTAGRGRHGRNWLSPPEAGLYMSVLVRQSTPLANLSLITLASGLAVAMAIEITSGLKIGLKWVNDLVLDGGKVGGILAELKQGPINENGQIDQSLVIGIGLNINKNKVDLPAELEQKVRWLEDKAISAVDRNLLVSQIAFELEQILALLNSGQSTFILDTWRQYSVTLGETIRATVGEKNIDGLALDIDDSGALLVQTANGMQQLHAGEISIRKSDGTYC